MFALFQGSGLRRFATARRVGLGGLTGLSILGAFAFSSRSVDAEGRRRPVVIAGPSGVGKGTLGGKLLKDYPEVFKLSSSHTTRKPRPGEVHGVHYWFVSREEFLQGVKDKKFIEYNEFSGNLYGTSVDAVRSVQDDGKVCLLDIDINGAKALKSQGMDVRYVFIKPPEPAFQVLEERLKGRGTDDPVQMASRLSTAKIELQFLQDHPEFFDVVIVNADLDSAYVQLKDYLKEDLKK